MHAIEFDSTVKDSCHFIQACAFLNKRLREVTQAKASDVVYTHAQYKDVSGFIRFSVDSVSVYAQDQRGHV